MRDPAQTIGRVLLQTHENDKPLNDLLPRTVQSWHDVERRYKNGDRGQTYHFTHVCGQETTQDEYFQLTTANMVSSAKRQWLPAHVAAFN